MAWSSLQLNASGHITIPSTFGGQDIDVILRTDKGGELTYLEGDANILAVQVRTFTLIPNSGSQDTLVQILGGHPGITHKHGHDLLYASSDLV